MPRKKAYIKTFGCQMNVYDTSRMHAILAECGYARTDDPDDADLVVVNSCSVRDKAEHKAISELGKFRKVKERRPDLRVGFAGCVAQQFGERIVKQMPFVDFVLGTQSIHRLPEILAGLNGSARAAVVTEMSPDRVVEELFPLGIEPDGVCAFVSIMRGCNNFCAYCIVPYVRGREVSRRPDDVVAEVRGLVDRGVREVTLLGQNVNSYGRGLAEPSDFADLLERVEAIDGLARIRFATSNPKDFNPAMIRRMAEASKVCEHLHLPVQSGSDGVLAAMGRRYTVSDYLAKIDAVRAKIPEVAITSDFIVGFPGETEDDFVQTMDLIERVRFDGLFSFRYSTRPGTKAAELAETVGEDEKLRRLKHLQQTQRDITRAYAERLLGKTVEILVEGTSRTDPERMTGRTRTNRIVNFRPAGAAVGEVVRVEIERVLENSLAGVQAGA